MSDLFAALEIVLDLARQNVIDEKDMPEEHARQTAAIDAVEGFLGTLQRLPK